MAIKPINDFLTVYKKLENALFDIDTQNLKKVSWLDADNSDDEDINVFWLENHAKDGSIQNKLRLCRMIRNYAQHNEDYKSFLAMQSDMILFINKVLKDLGCIDKTAGQLCKKVQALSEKSILSDCCTALINKKTDWLPVVDSKSNKCLGIVTNNHILSWISDGATLKTKLSSLLSVKNEKAMTLVQDDVKYNSIPNADYIVIIKDDIYKGIIVND